MTASLDSLVTRVNGRLAEVCIAQKGYIMNEWRRSLNSAPADRFFCMASPFHLLPID